MSAIFNSSSDVLYRTSGIMSYNSAYTIMAWFWMDASPNAYGYMLCQTVGSSVDNEDMTGNWDTTLQLRVNSRVSGVSDNQLSSTTLNDSTWYHIAMVRESTTVLKLYIDGTLEATSTQDATGRTANDKMDYGSNEFGAFSFIGYIAAGKEWTVALNQTEVSAEMGYYAPVKSANINAWYPMDATRTVNDQSGNGYTLSNSGVTFSDANNPSISESPSGVIFPVFGNTNSAIFGNLTVR